MKRLALIIIGGITLVAVIAVARTLMLLPARAPIAMQEISAPPEVRDRYAQNLAAAIRFKTISTGDGAAPDHAAFAGFHAFLQDTYPAAHVAMNREVVADYSLIYRWPGSDATKKPIAFTAHMDVVPVPAFGLADWQHDPFAGIIDDDGVIWGRGAMDDKGMLIALMETIEKLAQQGFVPNRDVYLMFGHDEEIGGGGASAMAALLKARGIQFSWLIDEGSAMVEGAVPGVESTVALISLGEKGSVTLKLSAEDEGGHSSAPKRFTAASLAARAGYLVTDNPYPLVLDENLERFLMSVAPEMDFGARVAIANLWATRPLLRDQLAENPTLAAFMHTTTAFTMMQSGTKSNILPQYGEAIVNYRIHPRDTVAGVIERARRIIDDPRVVVEQLGGRDATSMSSTDSEGYTMIAGTIKDVFGPIPTAPTLTVQATDGRFYYGVSDDVYRFTPFVFRPGDLKRIHGTNEAMHRDDLVRQVAFFEALISKAASVQ
ncbi:M20/M25/M40 family metallo-hydrolase [Kordiimonas aquimaris]|uniref:M20/M25/M40 family metallo-hydrolase n=1 Tax=Kordiimonas aquimaris TaxID=707591 RepID=UPI0021CEF015|nr:M20/M25/M40 family metallo-hydrolase [Kordiimonas aquimaris]